MEIGMIVVGARDRSIFGEVIYSHDLVAFAQKLCAKIRADKALTACD
jgi:hypothetical protein